MLNGVIEGFYGRGWTESERVSMLDWIQQAGMNTFVYGPKDDVHVRARWRENYSADMLSTLKRLTEQASDRNVDLLVALAPCLDMTYSDPAEMQILFARMDQLLDIGIKGFAILFDDVPNQLPPQDQEHFPTFAAAQVHVSNQMMAHLKPHDGKLLFCPTEYCARFTEKGVAASEYLKEIGNKLDKSIGIFWTGPEIVSETIPAATLREIGTILQRKPVIWENFHANDYDIRRVMVGPLGGRDEDILPLIDGFITNPNNELLANFVPVHTTGQFLQGKGYDEHQALDAAIGDWQQQFKLAFSKNNETLTRVQIRLLTELFYQPSAIGPEIQGFFESCKKVLSTPRPDVSGPSWQTMLAAAHELKQRIINLFDKMTELEDRELFHTFHRYLWEAREEMTHLVSYLDWLNTSPGIDETFPGEERIHNFYRLGFGAEVQDILKRDATGRYFHETRCP